MKYLILAIVLAIAALGLWLTIGDSAAIDPDDRKQVARGMPIYETSCAACHGSALEGQNDWQTPDTEGYYPAPPHDEGGHTWHHSDKLLFNYTKLGGQELYKDTAGYKSAMPGFGDTLSDQDIRDVLAFIKSHWSARAREFQSRATENDT